MEEVLETYEKAHDPDCPVVCMDQQPVAADWRDPRGDPRDQGAPQSASTTIRTQGDGNIFMFAEPLSGFRQATARPHRTKDDWAHEVAQILDTRYPNTLRITLVCDNQTTQTDCNGKSALWILSENSP